MGKIVLQRQNSTVLEQETPLERALSRQSSSSEEIYLELISNKEKEQLSDYVSDLLRGCIFIGHTNTDVDSVSSAIAAAYLFEGVASKANENLNGEIMFCLEKFKYPAQTLPLFKDVFGKNNNNNNNNICLVDHNQTTQFAEGVKEKHIVCIIDHHALQGNALCTHAPILIDIKPWGSTCTMITKMFYTLRRKIPAQIAGLLLCGILSDTLNLRSPTTTPIDECMVSLLSKVLSYSPEQVNALATEMFTAKSRAALLLSAHEIVLGDCKEFDFATSGLPTVKMAFGVMETLDANVVLENSAKLSEIVMEMHAIKKEKKLEFMLFAIVDTSKLNSFILSISSCEKMLLERTFSADKCQVQNKVGYDVFVLNGMVSRKKDFLPPLSTVLETFRVPKEIDLAEKEREEKANYGEIQWNGDGCCKPVRLSLRSAAFSVIAMNRLQKLGGKLLEQGENYEKQNNNALVKVLGLGVIVLGFGLVLKFTSGGR